MHIHFEDTNPFSIISRNFQESIDLRSYSHSIGAGDVWGSKRSRKDPLILPNSLQHFTNVFRLVPCIYLRQLVGNTSRRQTRGSKDPRPLQVCFTNQILQSAAPPIRSHSGECQEKFLLWEKCYWNFMKPSNESSKWNSSTSSVHNVSLLRLVSGSGHLRSPLENLLSCRTTSLWHFHHQQELLCDIISELWTHVYNLTGTGV